MEFNSSKVSELADQARENMKNEEERMKKENSSLSRGMFFLLVLIVLLYVFFHSAFFYIGLGILTLLEIVCIIGVLQDSILVGMFFMVLCINTANLAYFAYQAYKIFFGV